MGNDRIIGAIEIGTSKVVVLVGEVVGDRSLNIVGMGQSTSMGVKKGEIVNFGAASNTTHAAIMAAEKSAGTTIETVYLTQTGGHLDGFFSFGAANVSASDGLVLRADIESTVANAKRKQPPPGRVYIHHINNGFRLDGRAVDDPETMKGERLEVGYWHVHGDERKVSDQIHVINGFGLQVQDIILSSIASGCMVADEEARKSGVLVIDIGCGTTDYALYFNGCVARTGVVRVGGDHLTNDLSIGLRISRKHAEDLKLQFGKAVIDKSDKNDAIWLFGDLTIGDRKISKGAIYQIIHARVEELFSIIKRDLGAHLDPHKIPAGVILSGGCSGLRKIAEESTRVLGVTTRVGENPAWVLESVRQPEYSSVLGVLYYGLTAQRTAGSEQSERGIFRKMARMLNFA